jgi:hypothetical protein
MAKQDSTLSFNNYSTETDESQMVLDLLLNPHIVSHEKGHAALLEQIRKRTEGFEVFAVTFLMKQEITFEKPSEGAEGGES